MKNIYENTTIILDTNILNHIFSQQINDGEKILALFKKYRNKLWIPYTVYKEFKKIDIDKLKQDRKNEFNKIAGNLKNEYTNYVNKVTSISIEIKSKGFFEWDNFVDSHIQKLNEDIERLKEKMKGINEKEYIEKLSNLIEEVCQLLDNLLSNRQVGTALTVEEMIQISQEGKIRYEELIPPGFSDSGKKGVQKYNDLFIWKEIIRFAKERASESPCNQLIFITDDFKEGNWWENAKENKRPCELLMQEFKEACPDDYENKFFTHITFKSLGDFLKDNKDIVGKISLAYEKDKMKDALVNLYRNEISDDLYYFVFELEPSEIDSLFSYPNNDGEIYQEDLEIDSYDVQVIEDKLTCKILINQLVNTVFAYEDNEGDRFVMGEAELQVCSTVLIESKLNTNIKLGEEFVSLSKEDYTCKVENISYNVINTCDHF